MRVYSLSFPAYNEHAPYYIATCRLSGFTIFSHIISQHGTIFGKKFLNIKYVFGFPLKILSETFLILRRIQRDAVINPRIPSHKVPVILVTFQ